MKTKIQIKSNFGNILFEFEKENNSIKETLLEANLREADLYEADLRGADLREANLYGADLCEANLRGANLREADLRGANLHEADLREANLYGADLREAKGIDTVKLRSQIWIIPEEGAFIAWKKAADNCVVKLEIPAEAKRICNTNNRKCRAEFVKTIAIYNNDGQEQMFVCGLRDNLTIYKVGEITKPDSLDENIFEDCSHGIHFFITRKEAEDWNN